LDGKANAVEVRYVGVCHGCGAYTQLRNGKRHGYRYCKRWHPGAVEPRRTRELVLEAMRGWRERYGQLPFSYDWSRTHARRRGRGPLRRLDEREWPAASVVTKLVGTWAVANVTCEQRESGGAGR
jgi:hypothetical protein